MIFVDRAALRILEIDYESDASTQVDDVNIITYFRDAQSRTAGNGRAIAFEYSDLEGGTRNASTSSDQSLNSAEVWIWLGEVLPPANVIVLSVAA